ncbi:MAG TPA: hypothetical protein VMA31_03575, partial [Bryobacteraceae bacterium]|nr:hypothetical protein [Bryobacteraceae bacterium]
VHGATLAGAVHAVIVAGKGEVIVRALTIFFAFIPFFALFEVRRVMGEDRFLGLFLGREPRPDSASDPHMDAREPIILKH